MTGWKYEVKVNGKTVETWVNTALDTAVKAVSRVKRELEVYNVNADITLVYSDDKGTRETVDQRFVHAKFNWSA